MRYDCHSNGKVWGTVATRINHWKYLVTKVNLLLTGWTLRHFVLNKELFQADEKLRDIM